MSIKTVLTYILESKDSEAYSSLPGSIKEDCIRHIIYRQKLSDKEAISIFFEGFETMASLIRKKKFTYVDDASFMNYLQKICISKSVAYKKVTRGYDYIAPPEYLEATIGEFEQEYQEILKEDVRKKEKDYDLSLDINKLPEKVKAVVPTEVVRAFHTLKDECKLMVVLKDMLRLNYKEIYETLSIFYKIKNPQVCKAKMIRCRKILRIATVNFE